MSVQIIHGNGIAAMYCTTSGFAFGPTLDDDRKTGKDAEERMQAFFRWLDSYRPADQADLSFFGQKRGWNGDPRRLTDVGLERAYLAWLGQESEQYKSEEEPTPTEEST